MTPYPNHWPRAIILIDMNAFFASIEQLDFPLLQHKPVAVTNGLQGSCIITCSYEARAYGIHTGMRLREARIRCPQLIQRSARPIRYAQISQRIMAALQDITPDIEVFSVDEAFLDVTHCQQLWGDPATIGLRVKETVLRVSQLLCSIGISGDKTTAKYAAKCQKPNGFTVIPPWTAKERLQRVLVTDLCGIGPGIGQFLARYGVHTCGDVAQLPIGILAKRFGNLGRRIWYMCQGQDPEPLKLTDASPKTLGHGKVIPPNTVDPTVIQTYLLHMSEKLAARLRYHHLQAQHFYIGLRSAQGWLGSSIKTVYPTQDSRDIFKLCQSIYTDYGRHQPVSQVQVTALDPTPHRYQLDLWQSLDNRRDQLHQVVDCINLQYGEFTLAPARLLERSTMPNVIAPSWKPTGHRQTIV